MDLAQKAEHSLNAVGAAIVLGYSICFILMGVGIITPSKSALPSTETRIIAFVVGLTALALFAWGVKHFAQRIRNGTEEGVEE
jgi:hypothetical protein